MGCEQRRHGGAEARRIANYQSVNIAPDLSIAENYFLGCQPKKGLFVDWKKMKQDSQKVIDKFEMHVDPAAKIRELPIAMQAMVTISKISINKDIRLVILDEPTALLENDKVEILFRFVRELKAQGRQRDLHFPPHGRNYDHLRFRDHPQGRHLCGYHAHRGCDQG